MNESLTHNESKVWINIWFTKVCKVEMNLFTMKQNLFMIQTDDIKKKYQKVIKCICSSEGRSINGCFQIKTRKCDFLKSNLYEEKNVIYKRSNLVI